MLSPWRIGAFDQPRAVRTRSLFDDDELAGALVGLHHASEKAGADLVEIRARRRPVDGVESHAKPVSRTVMLSRPRGMPRSSGAVAASTFGTPW